MQTTICTFFSSNQAEPYRRSVSHSGYRLCSRFHPFLCRPDCQCLCCCSTSCKVLQPFCRHIASRGHTALYWAIVNNRPEALSAFFGFISQISSVCSSDLRLACMTASDHALFTRLELGGYNDRKDEPLRRPLGCPSDEI
ncbi:hypothetical protein DFH29DRAFT_373831 [Suillus ampliporus]|nr:hypothetical protein DFH29DRAFT_373831 [Suillus ampliporus]